MTELTLTMPDDWHVHLRDGLHIVADSLRLLGDGRLNTIRLLIHGGGVVDAGLPQGHGLAHVGPDAIRGDP